MMGRWKKDGNNSSPLPITNKYRNQKEMKKTFTQRQTPTKQR
jgi:hypothetical protein